MPALHSPLNPGNAPIRVVRMIGDTSLAMVNRHVFNIDDEMLEEIVEGCESARLRTRTPPRCELSAHPRVLASYLRCLWAYSTARS